MARFQTELENLQQQQKEAIERLQTLEADAAKMRELIIKIQGGIEVIQALEQQSSPQSAPEISILDAVAPDEKAEAI